MAKITAIEAIGTVAELVPLLRAAGLTHVITLAGPIPLDQWDPYGMSVCPGRNLRIGEERHVYRGELLRLDDGSVYVRDRSERLMAGFVLGAWQFTHVTG